MKPLPDWHSLQRLVAEIPRSAPGYTTNLYASRAQVDDWCAAGTVGALVTDDAVLVVRRELDFHRIYHVARCLPALTTALAALPDGRYVADVVGRGDALDEQCRAYANGGFVLRGFLRRMVRAQNTSPMVATDDIDIANPDDAEEVAAFLSRLLDRFVEQLPDARELRGAATEGRLLLVRQNALLIGMLMYDLTGQSAHLRFWHVDPGAHGAGIGRRLMTSFLSRCAHARRIVLWVIGDNIRSIAIYRHYGFETDGLLDRILIADKGK